MALEYSFFNSKLVEGQHDRTYTAEDITNYLKDIVGSGVFPNPSDCLQVHSGTGMTVYVSEGEGWIEGYRLRNTAEYPLAIEAADVTLNRIDRIVFRVNKPSRTMEIVVKKGTNASTPSAPSITRNADYIEYSLATIRVNKQTTSITNSMITDTRLDSSVCGVVQGLIQQVSTETLYQQWQDAFNQQYEDSWNEFNSWFSNVKENLAAATIVREYRNKIVTSGTNTTSAQIGIPQYLEDTDILNVYVNGLRLTDTEYTATEETVTFTKTIDEDGTIIEIVVQKSIDGSDAETVVAEVGVLQTQVNNLTQEHNALSEEVTAIQGSFRTPSKLYSGTLAVAQLSSMVYTTISGLSNYDIVIVRCEIGTAGKEDKIFYKGTMTSNTQTQTMSAYLNSTHGGLASITCDLVQNRVGIRAEAVSGWEVNTVKITGVFGIKLV